MLTGLYRPDAGEVLWQGQPLHQVRRQLPSKPVMDRPSAIETRLKTALRKSHFYHRDGDTAQCLEALAQAGLAGFEDIPVNQLWPGNDATSALARLWLTRAALWILDEPFTAIDVNGVNRLTQRMARRTGAGGLSFLTTHRRSTLLKVKFAGISLTRSERRMMFWRIFRLELRIAHHHSAESPTRCGSS
ncbi:ATP-binding cassette domain-containing protein [Escherichia coli]